MNGTIATAAVKGARNGLAWARGLACAAHITTPKHRRAVARVATLEELGGLGRLGYAESRAAGIKEGAI